VYKLNLILSILYMGEEEGSCICVQGDLGKFIAECAGYCSCVRRVGRSFN